MIKVVSCRFHKYLGPFHMLTPKGCSETPVFKERSTQVVTVFNFGNRLAIAIIFFGLYLEFDEDSINGKEN